MSESELVSTETKKLLLKRVKNYQINDELPI